MRTIKFTPTGKIAYISNGNGVQYQKGYLIGNLPNSIGCITTQNETEGISSWINYKGLTYINSNEADN